jgi:mycothiol system anti-sigma-R factor
MDSSSQQRNGQTIGKDPECREALDRLYTFLDGELTETRRHEIQEHLSSCLPCLEAFDFEAELKVLIATRCRDEVPAQLRVRVEVALHEAATVVGSDPTALAASKNREQGARRGRSNE